MLHIQIALKIKLIGEQLSIICVDTLLVNLHLKEFAAYIKIR